MLSMGHSEGESKTLSGQWRVYKHWEKDAFEFFDRTGWLEDFGGFWHWYADNVRTVGLGNFSPRPLDWKSKPWRHLEPIWRKKVRRATDVQLHVPLSILNSA